MEIDDCANLPCAPPIAGPMTNDVSKHPGNKKSDINKTTSFLITQTNNIKVVFLIENP